MPECCGVVEEEEGAGRPAEEKQHAVQARPEKTGEAAVCKKMDNNEASRENEEGRRHLKKLASFGFKRLAQEPRHLRLEAARLDTELDQVTVDNYYVHVRNQSCMVSIQREVMNIEDGVSSLESKVPDFTAECASFLKNAEQLASKHLKYRQTLRHHTQLLEILELPQLMDTCVRNNLFDEAIDLGVFANTLERRHALLEEDRLSKEIKGGGAYTGKRARSGYDIIASVVEEVRASQAVMHSMLTQQLSSQLSLTACLRIIGQLKRLSALQGDAQRSAARRRAAFLQVSDVVVYPVIGSIIPRTVTYEWLVRQ